MAKFQNLNVSYNQLRGFSVSDRVSMMSMPSLGNVLSSLTPEQFASLFPRYYYRNIPDPSNFMKSLTPETRKFVEKGGGLGSSVSSKPPVAQQKNSAPAWQSRIQSVTGINISDPSAKARVTEDQSIIWKELKEKNTIAADSPRVAVLNKLSNEDLAKTGIEKTQVNGKDVFKLTPTKASQVTDNEIETGLRSSSSAGMSPREKAVSDFIARREGASDPNTVFGGPKFAKQLGLDKVPLTERSLADVFKLQGELRELVKAAAARGELPNVNAEAQRRGSSAVGRGQFIESTLKLRLKEIGIPERDWDKIKFDEKLQEKLTLQNFRKTVGDPNGDPSQWNMNGLTGQWEAFKKRGPTSGELQNIATQSNQKPSIGSITPQMIADERARRIAAEEDERQQNLAGSQLPVPEGLSPKLAEEYVKMKPGEKQSFHDALKSPNSEGLIADLNKQYAGGNTTPLNSVLKETVHETHQQSARQRPLPIKPELKDMLRYAAENAGVEFETTSGGQERGKGTGSHRHDIQEGTVGAVDGRFFVREQDAQGKEVKRYLSIHNKEDLPKIQTFVKSFSSVAPGAGIGTNYMGSGASRGQIMHLGGPNKPGGAALVYAGKEFVEDAFKQGRSQFESGESIQRFNEWKKARDEEEAKLRSQESAAQRVTPKQSAPTVIPAPAGSPGASNNMNSTSIETNSAPTVISAPPGSPGASGQSQQPATQQPATQQSIVPVPANAYGGEVETDSQQITALPIGGLKGDNSVVVDDNAKPIFTMNTNESVSMKDGRAKIEPAQKTDPAALETKDVPQAASARQSNEAAKETRDVVMVQQQPISSGISSVVGLSENPIQTASFARAMAANRMQKTTDPLGGHFDQGSSNLK